MPRAAVITSLWCLRVSWSSMRGGGGGGGNCVYHVVFDLRASGGVGSAEA
jgi:hypothetical protein